MVFDFSRLNLRERPILILETLSGKKLQTLGYASEITPQLSYNEVSTLQFKYPEKVNGVPTPHYQDLVGWNIIEWKNLGNFILMDPEITVSNGYEIKKCQAYSLEFELVFKKFVLPEGVYNFWNPASPESTVLGMIMETIPYWHLGDVDSTLIGVYRTYDEQSVNLYDFIKSTLQKTVNCIFEFDTLTRTIHVRDVSSRVNIKPVFLSSKNLLKDIDLSEDSQSIVTCVDVNGAEGVTIMGVNPTGLNTIYNLDYFMNSSNFSDEIIQKWDNWKTSCNDYRTYYYNVTIERDLQTARWLVESAYLIQLQEELTGLERQQTAIIQSDDDNEYKNSQLESINKEIAEKENEISDQQAVLDSVQDKIDELAEELKSINDRLNLKNVFEEDEWDKVQKYIKEDSIEETTFVYPTVKAYNTPDESYSLSNQVCKIGPEENMPEGTPGITVTKISHSYYPDKTLYSINGGYITVDNVSANIIKGSFERNSDGTFVTSFYLGNGKIGDRDIKSGCIAISGSCDEPIDDTIPDEDTPESTATGTKLQFTISEGYIYVTENLTIYQQHSVEWDLLEWGEDTLRKLSSPTYSFDISSVNFLSIDKFDYFKKNLELGTKCYLKLSSGRILNPILIGVQCSYDDLSELVLEFSDTFTSSDPSFQMKDLLDKAISMGHRVDYSKYNYSSFISSGASTAVSDFITSSLDVAKNNITTATGQAISWNENGLRFRKWKDSAQTEYDPEQIWAINNQFVFTDDNFNSVKTAIGKIKVGDTWMYGVSGEALLGRLIAGNNLIIESEKTDGSGNSVFKVDGEGAQLHNAVFDVFNGSNTHLSINPYFGIAIGKYPVFTDNGSEGYIVDEDNAVFWVDLDGNLHIKGTLEVGSDGTFGGIVKAKDFQDLNGNSMLEDKDNQYQFKPDYLNLKGLIIRNSNNEITFQVTGDGHVSISGNVNMLGGSISWNEVGEPPSIDDIRNTANSAENTANSAKNTANSAASDIYNLATGNYTKAGSTFINGNSIYSPNLYFGSYGNYGYIKPGMGDNGTTTTNLIVIHGDKGLRIEAQGGGLAISAAQDVWTADSVWHMGEVRMNQLYVTNVYSISGNMSFDATRTYCRETSTGVQQSWYFGRIQAEKIEVFDNKTGSYVTLEQYIANRT